MRQLLGILALFSTLVTASAASAIDVYYLIIDGRGAGTLLLADEFGIVDDAENEHTGLIADPEGGCNGLHYHGFLFGENQTPEESTHCGWGRVVEVTGPQELLDDLEDLLSGLSDVDLAAKLLGIKDVISDAYDSRCYSLFLRAFQAMNDELVGARKAGILSDEDDSDILALLSQILLVGGADIAPREPEPAPEVPSKCKVKLKVRLSNGDWGTTVDPKSSLTFPRGSLVALEADGQDPGGTYRWKIDFAKPRGFHFKPAKPVGPKNDIPDFTAFGAQGNRANFMAQRGAKAKVTVTYKCPNGKKASDKLTITVR
jgi:hypothetical protein